MDYVNIFLWNLIILLSEIVPLMLLYISNLAVQFKGKLLINSKQVLRYLQEKVIENFRKKKSSPGKQTVIIDSYLIS